MNANISLEKYKKYQELINVYQTDMLKLISTDQSQSQQQQALIIAHIYSLQGFVAGLDTHIPTVSEQKEQQELILLSQQITVKLSAPGIQITLILESYYQDFLLVVTNNQHMPLQVKGTFNISEKSWVVEFDQIHLDISIESHAINKLMTILKEWYQIENKTPQDEVAIQQLIAHLVNVDESRNNQHRYQQVDGVQSICKTFYRLKYQNYEKYRLEVEDGSQGLVPYIFRFPFVPQFQIPAHLTTVGEEVLKSKKIPASPSEDNYELWMELRGIFVDQCISQLIEILENSQKSKDHSYQEVIKIHIEELRYSEWAKYKFINYILVGLFTNPNQGQ